MFKRDWLVLLYALLFLNASSLFAVASLDLDDFFDAWSEQTKNTSSFELKGFVESLITEADSDFESFDGDRQELSRSNRKKVQSIRITCPLEFILSGKEWKQSMEGDAFNDFTGSIQEMKNVIARSDGAEMSYVDGSTMPFASGMVDRTIRKHHGIIGTWETVPIAVWYDANSIFKMYSAKLDEAQITSKDIVSYDDSPSLELVIPCPKGRTIRLRVNKTSPHLIREWLFQRKGQSIYEFFLGYKENSEGVSLLNDWRVIEYNNDKIKRERRGSVRTLQINVPIEANRLRVNFPIGAHINERKPKGVQEYWIQQANGVQKPIKPEDFGREKSGIDNSEAGQDDNSIGLSLPATAIAVVILGLLSLRKHLA